MAGRDGMGCHMRHSLAMVRQIDFASISQNREICFAKQPILQTRRNISVCLFCLCRYRYSEYGTWYYSVLL